jgi:hypothetical protein
MASTTHLVRLTVRPPLAAHERAAGGSHRPACAGLELACVSRLLLLLGLCWCWPVVGARVAPRHAKGDRDGCEHHCPGRKPPVLAVKRPARPYKSPYKMDFHRKTLRALNRPEGPGLNTKNATCSQFGSTPTGGKGGSGMAAAAALRASQPQPFVSMLSNVSAGHHTIYLRFLSRTKLGKLPVLLFGGIPHRKSKFELLHAVYQASS